ncbi:ABC transporter ATP-binding protein [Novibacillus thermophilus]|uniref:Peptide ABC transporter ATP-binding protein n=1 Tax=Novibacillus thermophilus TaxID=1471761 RepID=A0A1U9KBN0_9BACL|nr:ABC transporter ATP-binding protein [Novibacillus thermophilus]AQS57477.1 peptide ABC transporter ATP-binding protein [Novibacillus thermophilus]
MSEPILRVNRLHTQFSTDKGVIPAVNGIDFSLYKGEIVGLVGESGCGKSVTSLSVLKLIPQPPGKISADKMEFKSEDLIHATERRMRQLRGNDISMIFQDPMSSLNPTFTIGHQISEVIRIHKKASRKEALRQSVEMLSKVGIPRAERTVKDYPHQLSGGMRQRVMIAMAMACQPELLIADEPTTALDVTIQAQILNLMKQLNQEQGTAILLITHDLGVVAEVCERVLVMYAGKVVEEGDVRSILKDPQHPYTQGLIASVPKRKERSQRLYSIPGTVPKPGSLKRGCAFAPRCTFAFDSCWKEAPELYPLGNGRRSRCLLHREEGSQRIE